MLISRNHDAVLPNLAGGFNGPYSSLLFYITPSNQSFYRQIAGYGVGIGDHRVDTASCQHHFRSTLAFFLPFRTALTSLLCATRLVGVNMSFFDSKIASPAASETC